MDRRDFVAASAGLALVGGGTAQAAPAAEEAVKLTPAMEQAREAGLKAIKPAAKELEHGLKLHAESVVFDAYGFAPRAAIDNEALRQAFEAGASDSELQDLREEMGMIRCAADPAERAEFETAWRAAGVTCIFQNAGEEGQDPLRLLARLARFTYVTDALRGFVSRAATPDDIESVKKAGKHCLYLTGNGVPLNQRWATVEDELKHVRVFFQLGIRMMHMTYNRRNMLGDGCGEEANGGISDLGRAAIAEMNRTGVIVDVAHSGWRTSLEAAKASSRPMVASHTTAAALHKHIRGKPDEVVKAIADTGGYVGVCCIPSFLNGGITAFLDHIDYLVRKFGADHVAIGTDVAHSAPTRPGGGQPFPSRKQRTRFEALWPKGSLDGATDPQRTLAWTNWPLFTVGLVQRGYSDADIRKIIGGNVLRVARDALKGVPGLSPVR
ncbi:MAG: dipeptidase [Planctomycetes bacterium]|nr:dipeptidase [Planctomycetota bacterium]